MGTCILFGLVVCCNAMAVSTISSQYYDLVRADVQSSVFRNEMVTRQGHTASVEINKAASNDDMWIVRKCYI